MPYPSTRIPNHIDAQANSPARHRRNWQRLRDGALTDTIKVAAPITNAGGSLGLNIDNLTIVLSGSTLTVPIDPAGGIVVNPGGLAVNIDNVTLKIDGSGKLFVNLPRIVFMSNAGTSVTANTTPQAFPGFSFVIPSGILSAVQRLYRVTGTFRGSTTAGNTLSVEVHVAGTNVQGMDIQLAPGASMTCRFELLLLLTTTSGASYGQFLCVGGTPILFTLEAGTSPTATGAVTVEFFGKGLNTNSDPINLDMAVVEEEV